jgi:hypothetical protein
MMPTPRKLYRALVKPHAKTPPRKSVDATPPEVRVDMLEAVRRTVIESQEKVTP